MTICKKQDELNKVKQQISDEIKALRDCGVQVSDKAEKRTLEHAGEFDVSGLSIGEFVDMWRELCA